jgi:hypothetical protein
MLKFSTAPDGPPIYEIVASTNECCAFNKALLGRLLYVIDLVYERRCVNPRNLTEILSFQPTVTSTRNRGETGQLIPK